MRVNRHRRPTWMIGAIASCLLVPGLHCYAQQTQEEIEAMMEAMKDAGLGPEAMQQMESMLEKIGEQEEQRKAARQDISDWEFDEVTEGKGNAFVTIDGQQLTMRVVRCETHNMAAGAFSIEAQVALNPKDGRLLVNSYGTSPPSLLRYTDEYRDYRVDGPTMAFDGQNLEWSGRVDGPDGDASLSVQLSCRAVAGEQRPSATGPLQAPDGRGLSGDAGDNQLSKMMQFQMGKPVIHIRGVQENPAPADLVDQVFVGDCDNARPEDDVEVMTFTAPWSIKGSSSGGSGDSVVGKRSLMLERDRGVAQKRLTLDFRQESKRMPLMDYISDHAVVDNIPFAGDEVKLVYVNQTTNLKLGYHAVFPLAQLEGFPMNMQESGRYLAHVHFGPVGAMNFDGWPQKDVIELFNSLRTSPCLSAALQKEFAVFSPTVVFD